MVSLVTSVVFLVSGMCLYMCYESTSQEVVTNVMTATAASMLFGSVLVLAAMATTSTSICQKNYLLVKTVVDNESNPPKAETL